jgi:hypothetical protein
MLPTYVVQEDLRQLCAGAGEDSDRGSPRESWAVSAESQGADQDPRSYPMTDPVPNRIRALHVADVHFVSEQSSEAEAELKNRWIQLLASGSGIAAAYLARVQYGESPETGGPLHSSAKCKARPIQDRLQARPD